MGMGDRAPATDEVVVDLPLREEARHVSIRLRQVRVDTVPIPTYKQEIQQNICNGHGGPRPRQRRGAG